MASEKNHFSTFSGKLTFQSSRNGSQNPPFCPGSLQDTFIIYSSISHQHNFQTYVAKKKSVIGNLEISKVDPGKLVDSFSPRDGPVLLSFSDYALALQQGDAAMVTLSESTPSIIMILTALVHLLLTSSRIPSPSFPTTMQ